MNCGALAPPRIVASVWTLIRANLIKLDLCRITVREKRDKVAVLRERDDLGIVPLAILLVDGLAFLPDGVRAQLLLFHSWNGRFHLSGVRIAECSQTSGLDKWSRRSELAQIWMQAAACASSDVSWMTSSRSALSFAHSLLLGSCSIAASTCAQEPG